MQNFVTGEHTEPGPLLPLEMVFEMLELVFVPSLHGVAPLQCDGKTVAEGVDAGAVSGR